MALLARRLALQRHLLPRGGSGAIAVPRRLMSGGHGHGPQEYTGAEAFVRKYLPENHHVRRPPAARGEGVARRDRETRSAHACRW